MVKDIHDLDGIHGYRRRSAAVTLIVHNNHEEVAAGNLLYDKRPAAQTETETSYNMISSRLNIYCLTWIDIVKDYLMIDCVVTSWPEAVPDTALTVDVARCFFDGAFGDEGRVFCITRHHHGFTPRSMS